MYKISIKVLYTVCDITLQHRSHGENVYAKNSSRPVGNNSWNKTVDSLLDRRLFWIGTANKSLAVLARK